MQLFIPIQIAKMAQGAVNKAYSALRSAANKRLERQAAQGIGMQARSGFRFPTIKEINASDTMSVQSQLADVSKFLRSERTTVSGEKKFLNEFKEDMINKGYGDLVKTNDQTYDLINFMDEMREQYSDKIFDSGDALDVLQETERLNIPIDQVKQNIDVFTQHLSDLEKVKPSKGGKVFSKQRMNRLIKKWNS